MLTYINLHWLNQLCCWLHLVRPPLGSAYIRLTVCPNISCKYFYFHFPAKHCTLLPCIISCMLCKTASSSHFTDLHPVNCLHLADRRWWQRDRSGANWANISQSWEVDTNTNLVLCIQNPSSTSQWDWTEGHLLFVRILFVWDVVIV